MKGQIDEAQRALLAVDVRPAPDASPTSVTVWIDTAFNGYFVFPKRLIDKLGLDSGEIELRRLQV